MIPATQIKVGMVILHDGKPCRVRLDSHPLQYLYHRSGDDFTFMNTESFEMSNVPADYLGDSLQYLVEGMTVEMSYTTASRSPWSCPCSWSWRSSRPIRS